MQKKQTSKAPQTVTEKLMSMILKLNLDQHGWVKSIAEATELPQPKVVNLVLEEAMKQDPDTYISQVKKAQAERRASQLKEQIQAAQNELKQLQPH
jgi:hypothetical protein